ncbi:MAG: tRNA pseudouridine(38-40) synthase TruA [Planctomycetota bacterium]
MTAPAPGRSRHAREGAAPDPASDGDGAVLRRDGAASPGDTRYKLTVAYDGSGFHGWQKQLPKDGPPLRTVQHTLEDVLVRLVGRPGEKLNLVGASRTDSGVHAVGQVAHFDAQTRIPAERMAEAITSRLPADVEVRSAEAVAPTFHAIRDAVRKRYRYRLWNRPVRPLDQRHVVYPCPAELDVDAMNDAARGLVGAIDLAGLSAAGHGRATTVRNVFACGVEDHRDHSGEVQIVIEGDGFLWNTVRIVAGTLVDVGRGRFGADVIGRVLETGDRALAGPTLPPQGLCLEWIRHASPPPESPPESPTEAHTEPPTEERTSREGAS